MRFRLNLRRSGSGREGLVSPTERFGLVTVAVVVLAAVIPALVVAMYANSQFSDMAGRQDVALLESFRDQQILRLKDQYRLEESQMRAYGQRLGAGASGRPKAPPESALPDHVRTAYWFDPAFAFAGVLRGGVAADVAALSRSLAGTAFTGPVVFGKWITVQGAPYQVAYLRLASTSGVRGYVGFLLDAKVVSGPLAGTNRDYLTDVISGDFDVVYSTDASRIGTRQVNEITKDMLGGNVGTAADGGATVAFGFVDIVAEPLYVAVRQAVTPNASRASTTLRFMGFIIAFFAVLAFIVAWRYLRAVQRFADDRGTPGVTERRRAARSSITAFLDESEEWSARLDDMSDRMDRFRDHLSRARDDLGTTPADAVSRDRNETEPAEPAGDADARDE